MSPRLYEGSKRINSKIIEVSLQTNEIAIIPKPYQYEWIVKKINQLPQIKLPEGQQEPVIV